MTHEEAIAQLVEHAKQKVETARQDVIAESKILARLAETAEPWTASHRFATGYQLAAVADLEVWGTLLMNAEGDWTGRHRFLLQILDRDANDFVRHSVRCASTNVASRAVMSAVGSAALDALELIRRLTKKVDR